MGRTIKQPSRELTAELIDGKAQAVAMERVSTSAQANTSRDEDGYSIQAQKEACEYKAEQIDAIIVRHFVDRGKSARTMDRPALQEMLTFITENPHIQYVIVHKLDRLARNRADDVALNLLFAKLGVRLVSATENIDDTPTGKLVRGIMSDVAEWYSANLGEEAKKGMRKKVEHGGTPTKAPLGYKNGRDTRDGKNIGIVTVDSVMGPIVTQGFKLYDSGLCTLADVADAVNDMGLRLPANKNLPERPISVQSVHRMLRNKYYTGIITYNGVEHPGEHEPLIDEATFERVQALLTTRNLNKDKGNKRPHHLKGNLFCAVCGRRLGITVPKNRHGTYYPYFYCLGRQEDLSSCTSAYMPVGLVEQAFRAYWGRVRLPAERMAALRQGVIENFAGKHADSEAEITRQKARLVKLEQARKKNKDAYYADAISLEEFKADQDRIRREVVTAEGIIERLGIEVVAITGALDEALGLLEDPGALYDQTPDGPKTHLVQTVFEKIWILDSEVAGSELTEPFAELLTLEARIALVESESDAPNEAHTATQTDEQRPEDSATYFRSAGSTPASLRALEADWERLQVERPIGFLPVDSKNPRPRRVAGSGVSYLVGLTGFEPATP